MTQEKLDKAKKSRNSRLIIVGIMATLYIVSAIGFHSIESNSPLEILTPISLGMGIGVFFVAFSIIFNYETTKQLIEIDDKLDEINKKLSIKD